MTGTVRPARPDDLDAVGRIYAGYVLDSLVTFEVEPPSPAEWSERFGKVRDLGLPFLVAELAGEVAGYAYCSPWRPRPAYRHTAENSIYVAPAAAGRGLGRSLLDELVAGAGASGIRQLIAVIADQGDPGVGESASVALHLRCGFVEVGRLRRVGLKHGRWLDTVLLQRELDGPEPDPA